MNDNSILNPPRVSRLRGLGHARVREEPPARTHQSPASPRPYGQSPRRRLRRRRLSRRDGLVVPPRVLNRPDVPASHAVAQPVEQAAGRGAGVHDDVALTHAADVDVAGAGAGDVPWIPGIGSKLRRRRR